MGICPPPQSEALPLLAPPSQKKRNGQNQPFSANFWILESHFALFMLPHKILVPPLPSGSDFTDIAISGVTGWGHGGSVPPETSDREISADLPRKRGNITKSFYTKSRICTSREIHPSVHEQPISDAFTATVCLLCAHTHRLGYGCYSTQKQAG